MAVYRADFRVQISVEFEDDGENDITDQAHDVASEAFSMTEGDLIGVEIIGKPTIKDGPQ